MPVSPYFGRRVGIGIIANINHLFVRRLRPRQPLAVDVVSPEKMIGDDRLGWMDDSNDAIERKGLVTLEVEHRSHGLRERPGGTVRAESCRTRNRRRIRSATASAECRHGRD